MMSDYVVRETAKVLSGFDLIPGGFCDARVTSLCSFGSRTLGKSCVWRVNDIQEHLAKWTRDLIGFDSMFSTKKHLLDADQFLAALQGSVQYANGHFETTKCKFAVFFPRVRLAAVEALH